MPVRALRLSKTSGSYHSFPCLNHRMPVRALRPNIDVLDISNRVVLSESSNARQGIKTLGTMGGGLSGGIVRIIECPSGH